MQFLNNIPSDFKLTQYFKPFYELYSVKTLPTQLSVDRAFGMVRHNQAYVQRCMEAKHAFDRHYVMDFDFDHKKCNRWGGSDTDEVQVLCDRCGYYIGRLTFDRGLYRWFVQDCFGSKHYPSRAIAEKICKRFKSIYKLR